MYSSNDENIRLLIGYMARDGFDEEEIAKRLGLKTSRIKKIIKNDEDLIRNLDYARILTDYRVEDSLLKRALGTTVTEIKTTEKKTGSETVTNVKEVPGDTAAIMNWLKARRPEKWGDKAQEDKQTAEILQSIFDSIDKMAKTGEEINEIQ